MYQLRANALIKRGSMYMQQQQPMLSTQDFNMAADIDPQNADVYHHRGQVRFVSLCFSSTELSVEIKTQYQKKIHNSYV